MANAIYPKYKRSLLIGANNISLDTSNVNISLVDNDEIVYSSTDEFFSDLNANGIVATAEIANTTVSDTGTFDGDDVTFVSLTGDESEALIIWINTGDANTSRLVSYLDTGITGLPITPDGSNTQIQWNTSGIFQL